MGNKKWTDADLRTAFEDGCKFVDFADLKDFLSKRRQLADMSERKLTIPNVSDKYEITYDREIDCKNCDDTGFLQTDC